MRCADTGRWRACCSAAGSRGHGWVERVGAGEALRGLTGNEFSLRTRMSSRWK